MKTSEKITKRIKEAGHKYWASDNVSQFMDEGDDQLLIEELIPHFEGVLDSLIIDRFNDPNSQGTAKRLAKMYINELMWGRYNNMPNATAFPNDIEEGYKGMLVVRSEIQSMCSHHHQPVKGVAYIGIIAGETLIGLSKYTRIAQWCARRGTLQEELANDISREIMKATGSKNLGVYIQATHGCVENRGVLAHSSLTQTTVLEGAFKEEAKVQKEFMDNIKLQTQYACGK
jgi:GTP cyclohydrolase I